MNIVMSKIEIENVIDLAMEQNGKFRGMTYEEGVKAALEWVIGITDVHPMED